MIRQQNSPTRLFGATSEIALPSRCNFYLRLRAALAAPYAPAFCAQWGRLTDPAVYLKLFVVAYLENITYDTDLAERVADSLAIREFLGYSLTQLPPDHSSISRNRARIGESCGIQTVREHNRETGEQVKVEVSNGEFRSESDPDARVTKKRHQPRDLSYKVTHVTDGDSGIILAADCTRADVGDAQAAEPATDCYTCPAGKPARFCGVNGAGVRQYRTRPADCRDCPHRSQCLSATGNRRTVTRLVHEQSRQRVVARAASESGRAALRRRKHIVEPPFGHMKTYGGLRLMNCRGLARARVRAVLAAVAWDLIKLVKALARRQAQRALLALPLPVRAPNRSRTRLLARLARPLFAHIPRPPPQPAISTPAPNHLITIPAIPVLRSSRHARATTRA